MRDEEGELKFEDEVMTGDVYFLIEVESVESRCIAIRAIIRTLVTRYSLLITYEQLNKLVRLGARYLDEGNSSGSHR